MRFDPFVIPFSVGFFLLFSLVILKFSRWMNALSPRDKVRLNKGIFSLKIFGVAKEVILESLFHLRIFKVNKLLGFMHMSFAFGWFMLILIGNVESRIYTGLEFNFPYFPIFFKFFVHEKPAIPFTDLFTFLMDFFLLLILSGILLAIAKRLYSRIFKMKRTSKIRKYDMIAMYSLWLIFPLRLMAESYSAALYGSGGFLTGSIGNLLAETSTADQMFHLFWWLYSIDLGIFFTMLPFSRYMHIPAEILLIAFRRFGIGQSKKYNSFKDLEVNSCPMCGICIDKCQLQIKSDISKTQSVYFIKSIRSRKVKEDVTNYCLICGRCKEFCPVKIDTDALRLSLRISKNRSVAADFNYISVSEPKKAEVLYFAGCMTHLTPTIKSAVISVLSKAKVSFNFIDEDGSICCGRPLMLAGQLEDAEKLVSLNKYLFQSTGAKTLVTSCPICYRAFKEDYRLGMEVLHHTEYFKRLIEDGDLVVEKSKYKVVYHDPCELGRGSGIFEEPREILKKISVFSEIINSEKNSLCCGGSVGNLQIKNDSRNIIAAEMVKELCSDDPDRIITSCPLCKKTMAKHSSCEVMDIAEILDVVT
jgi:Fe-S oxidoreductase